MSTNTQTIKPRSRLIALVGFLLALGLVLSFLIAFELGPASHLVAAAPAVSAGALRGRAADTARWEAMARYFIGKEAADLQRSRAADAARWDAMARYFAAKEASALGH